MQWQKKQRKQRRDDRPYIRVIEFVFYNEREIRLAIMDARAESNSPELRNGSGLPDPTATTAIRNLSLVPFIVVGGQELKLPERWLTVVEKTYDWCKRQGEKYYEIARAKYNGEYFVKTCANIDVSITRFYEIIEKIKVYAALQAAQLNLIHVD